MKINTNFTYLLYAIGLFSLPFFSFSQQAEIKSWQSANPHVEFISHERFNNLNTTEKEILAQREYILFDQEITVSDINIYAKKMGINGIMPTSPAKTNDDAPFIKEWIDQHRDVKIITQSNFNQLTPEEQQFVLVDAKHLVLQTDEITKVDILIFNNRLTNYK